jgi:outer membrane protein assembly factor BamB
MKGERLIYFSFVFIGILLIIGMLAAFPTIWTSFRYDFNNTGWDGEVYPVIGGLNNVSYNLSNYVYSSPIVVNGSVYAGTLLGNLFQLNATNVSHQINNVSLGAIYGGLSAANGYLYVPTDATSNTTYQLNATDLTQVANFTADDGFWSTPIISEGYAYVGSDDNSLYQLNATNISQLIANYSTGYDIRASPTVVDGYVYVGGLDNKLHQLNATNITSVVGIITVGNSIYTSVAISDGYAYFGSYDGQFYQVNATNVTQLVANYSSGSVFSSPAVVDGYVYIGSITQNYTYQLNATNITTQVANFTADNASHSFYSNVVIANGYAYVGCYDNSTYQLNATNISQTIANFSAMDYLGAAPAAANGYLYVGSFDNYLYQKNASDISLGNTIAAPAAAAEEEEDDSSTSTSSGVPTYGVNLKEETEMRYGYKYTFSHGEEAHRIYLRGVNRVDNSADFDIYSNKISVNVKVGEREYIDLDGDGTFDFALGLMGLVEGKIVAKTILEEYDSTTMDAEDKTLPSSTGVGGENQDTGEEEGSLTWIYVLLILILVAVVIFYFLKKRR